MRVNKSPNVITPTACLVVSVVQESFAKCQELRREEQNRERIQGALAGGRHDRL